MINDKGGIRIERWVEPEHVKARLAGRATLTPNSSKAHDHQDAAAGQVYEGLRSGQCTCLGAIGEWEAAHGHYPWNNGVSIEPKKPRLVTAPIKLDEHTAKQNVVLEGLSEVRENVRWDGVGEAPHQVAHDQKSGYNNMSVSARGSVCSCSHCSGFSSAKTRFPMGVPQRVLLSAAGLHGHLWVSATSRGLVSVTIGLGLAGVGCVRLCSHLRFWPGPFVFVLCLAGVAFAWTTHTWRRVGRGRWGPCPGLAQRTTTTHGC